MFGGVSRNALRPTNSSVNNEQDKPTSTQRQNAPKRKRSTSGVVGKTKTWNKDVVCLPESMFENNSTIPIPRGRQRGEIAQRELIGKIRLVSSWTAREVKQIFNNGIMHLYRGEGSGVPGYFYANFFRSIDIHQISLFA